MAERAFHAESAILESPLVRIFHVLYGIPLKGEKSLRHKDKLEMSTRIYYLVP